MSSTPIDSRPAVARYAGVHLSGANAAKTALVVLERRRGRSPLDAPMKIGKVYEKIGSFGTLFSDERLVEILTRTGPYAEVFVDCPLTVPPCVACQRPSCPGAVQCDDVSVAYMLAVSGQVRRRGARKARPVNPQSQRLWDVLQLAQRSGRPGTPVESLPERLEPSYSANLAPLVARARTLQRRLNALTPRLALKETSVSAALDAVRLGLRLPEQIRVSYRSFEDGLARRQEVVTRLLETGWLIEDGGDEDDALDVVVQSVETFHAFLTAWVAALHGAGLTEAAPETYVPGEGWVFLPELTSTVASEPAYFL